MKNNENKKHSPGKKPKTPGQLGEEAAMKFGDETNPFTDREASAAWHRSYSATRQKMAKSALSWFLLGAAVPAISKTNPQEAGQLVASVMQSNGQALVCCFVGAAMMHRSSCLPDLDTANDCFQAATYAASGRELPDHMQHKLQSQQLQPSFAVIASAYALAKEIIPYLEGTTEMKEGNPGTVTVDAHGIMKRIITGD